MVISKFLYKFQHTDLPFLNFKFCSFLISFGFYCSFAIFDPTFSTLPLVSLEMTSQERSKKFHTHDASLSRSGMSFWFVVSRGEKFASTNQKHYPDLGTDASSVWNSCARFSDVISRENSRGVAKFLLLSQAARLQSRYSCGLTTADTTHNFRNNLLDEWCTSCQQWFDFLNFL